MCFHVLMIWNDLLTNHNKLQWALLVVLVGHSLVTPVLEYRPVKKDGRSAATRDIFYNLRG